MSNEEKLDLDAPHLVGKCFETSEDGTEFLSPPSDYIVESSEDSKEELSTLRCDSNGCGNTVKVTEEGNTQYAWYYLTNSSNKYSGVTIERRWVYQGQWRKDTVRHRLYPGQHKEVFSFPRNQRPMCCIIACNHE